MANGLKHISGQITAQSNNNILLYTAPANKVVKLVGTVFSIITQRTSYFGLSTINNVGGLIISKGGFDIFTDPANSVVALTLDVEIYLTGGQQLYAGHTQQTTVNYSLAIIEEDIV